MIRSLIPALAAAALCCVAACDSGAGGPSTSSFPGEGDPYPTVTVQDCSGADVDLGAWIGQHEVNFITFAAKWCTACQEEAPRLNSELVDGFAGQPVGVAQILVEDDPGVAPPLSLCADWRDSLGARFSVFVDLAQASVPDHFGDAVATLPMHFIVTRDGVIRLRKVGPLPANIEDLVRGWLP